MKSIAQGIKNQRCNLDGLAQENEVLAISNSTVMAKLKQLTISMGMVHAQLKTLSSSATTITKLEYYCWRGGRNFSQGSKECTTIKARQKDEAYHLDKTWGKLKEVIMAVKGNNEKS